MVYAIFAFLALTFFSLYCGSWWVMVAGLVLAAIGGGLFGAFRTVNAHREWAEEVGHAVARETMNRSAAIFGIVVMLILIVGLITYRARESFGGCGIRGCSSVEAPAMTTLRVVVTKGECTPPVHIPSGVPFGFNEETYEVEYDLCLPNGKTVRFGPGTRDREVPTNRLSFRLADDEPAESVVVLVRYSR